MRTAYLFNLLLFFITTACAQKTPMSTDSLEDIRSYDYQTKLTGGYKILFKADDDTEYLYLTKKGKKIAELSSGQTGMPYKNLGYVAADFNDCFVLVHSYGSGNPHEIELIKKSTGKNILKINAWWIDVIEKKEVLLYSNQDVPTEKDRMILHNIRTGQKRSFPFPKDMFDEPMILYRIKIKTLTSKFLIIEYEVNGHSKTKKYII
jgi:hypothetical protein